jgi:mycofactocin precursor
MANPVDTEISEAAEEVDAEEIVVEEILVEEVSIDGMCGVY